MTDRLRTISVEQPDEEDAHRKNLRNDESTALIVKSRPLKEAVAMQQPTNAELVLQWLLTDSEAVTDSIKSSMMVPAISNITTMHSESSPQCSQGVRTALLAGSRDNSTKNRRGMEPSLVYGTNGFVQPGQSILRLSPNNTSSVHGLKKSASVDFVLDHTHGQQAQSLYPSTSSIGREPRRLTFEEKTELYRVRPDLEIGPAPFYNEKIDELNRRNQRRIIFAMFGGMITILLMLVFFFLGEKNE